MFFGGTEDDDEDDFNPASSGSSKLSALFGGSPDSKSSNSLKYVAPKQPRGDQVDTGGTLTPGEQASGNKLASAVLVAVPVQAYLYLNQVPQSQGQAMCCVLGDVATANFQLLLYRSKQDHLTRARISQHFTISVQPNYYANFMDDLQRSWSIMLEPRQYVDLLTQIGICRALVESCNNKSMGNVVAVQDVGLGEGPGLKEGDQAQLSVTTNIIAPTTGKRGEQLEERADQRVKIKDRDDSWMGGLVGGQKNTHRLIFTHRSKDRSGGLVVYDVTVSRVRQKAGGGSGGEQSGRSTPQVESTPPQLPSATQVRENASALPASEVLLEEPPAEPNGRPTPSSRAHLMSRMARVGRQLLPTQLAHPAPHPHPTDSESEVEEISHTKGGGRLCASEGSTEELAATPAMSRPTPSPKPLPPHHPHPHQQMVVYQSAFHPHPSAMPGEYVSATVAPQPAPPAALAAPDPTLSLLFSETRSQNTEVKISVARMSDKIDTLVSKIEKLEQQQQHQMAVTGMSVNVGGMMIPQYPNPTLTLATSQTDPQALLSQVTSIVKENEGMKTRLEEREAKVAALNDSLTQLLHKNQKLLEEKTSMLEAQGAGAAAKSEVTELREERAKLAGQVSLASHQLDTLRDELSQSKERVQAKDREMEKLKAQIEAQLATLQDDHTAKEALLNEKNLLQEKLENAQRESEKLRRESRKESEGAKREKEEAIREMEDIRKHLESTGGKEGVQEMQAGLKREVEMSQAENQGLKKKMADLEQQMEMKRQQLKELETKVASHTAQCSQLEEEKLETSRKFHEQLKNVSSEKSQLETRLEAAERQQSVTTTSNNTENMVATVKRVMNTVYHVLKPQFLPSQTYDGKEVIQSLLVVIRDTTLSMMEELEKNNIVDDNKKFSGLAADGEKLDQGADKEESVRRDEGVTSGSPDSTSKARVETGETMAESTGERAGPENSVGDFPKPHDNSGSCEGDVAVTAPTVTGCSSQHTVSNVGQNGHDSQGISTVLTGDRDHDEETIEKLTVKLVVNKGAGEKTNVKTVVEDIMKKKPVIDLSTTGTTGGRSDSSRDSSLERGWRPQPPTPPLFSDEDEDDCDWLS